MRAVGISVILFFALILCMTANSVYIDSSAEYISQISSSLDDKSTREQVLSDLDEFWVKNRRLIELTVPRDQLSDLSAVIVCLKNAASHGNEEDFDKYRGMLFDMAKDLGKYEISLNGTRGN